jgi:hypothetical protein
MIEEPVTAKEIRDALKILTMFETEPSNLPVKQRRDLLLRAEQVRTLAWQFLAEEPIDPENLRGELISVIGAFRRGSKKPHGGQIKRKALNGDIWVLDELAKLETVQTKDIRRLVEQALDDGKLDLSVWANVHVRRIDRLYKSRTILVNEPGKT